MIRGKKKKSETSRKVVDPPAAWGRLLPLVLFLNDDLDKPHNSRNTHPALWILTYRDFERGTVDENLKPLQSELIEALSPIAQLPEGGQKRFKRRERRQAAERTKSHLVSLLGILDWLKFEPRFKLLPAKGKINRNREGVFSWGAGRWIVKMDFSAGIPYDPKRDFYGIIAEGLMTGELARLRQCAYCKVYFVAEQPRVRFCPGHARKYYDMIKFHPELAATVQISREPQTVQDASIKDTAPAN
jgi:hypothetical protein